MADRRYTNPRTGEINDDPEIRPFNEFIRDLGEGSTNTELSEALWDLLQRVQDTGKAGMLTLQLAIGFDGGGRVIVKDAVSLKLPEFSRPTTAFFIDKDGNASRRDPNQPQLPSLDHRRALKEGPSA